MKETWYNIARYYTCADLHPNVSEDNYKSKSCASYGVTVCEAHGIISQDIILPNGIGRPRDSMCEAHGILSASIC